MPADPLQEAIEALERIAESRSDPAYAWPLIAMERRDIARQALTRLRTQAEAPKPAESGEWVIVPREPTEEWLSEVAAQGIRVKWNDLTPEELGWVWRALIAAAPSRPSTPAEAGPPAAPRPADEGLIAKARELHTGSAPIDMMLMIDDLVAALLAAQQGGEHG